MAPALRQAVSAWNQKEAGLVGTAAVIVGKALAAAAVRGSNAMVRAGLVSPEDRKYIGPAIVAGLPATLLGGYVANRVAQRYLNSGEELTPKKEEALIRASGVHKDTPVGVADDSDDAYFEPTGPLGEIRLGQNMSHPATLAHELGHASIHQGGGLSRVNQSWLRPLSFLPSAIAAGSVGPAAGLAWGPAAGLGLGALAGVVAGAPTLINEWQASSRAKDTLKALGPTPAQTKANHRDLHSAFGTYLTGAALPAAAIGLGAGLFKHFSKGSS